LKYRILYLLSVILILTFLTGCGTDKELEEYKANMEIFYADLSAYDTLINSIDVSSETSVSELLTALDGLEERFTWMASLAVPEEFAVNESLAAQAGEYMTHAVTLFHQAYESEPFDNAAAQAAHEYYERANKRAVYILAVLHGEMPVETEAPADDEASAP
jgi:hypothetical protein